MLDLFTNTIHDILTSLTASEVVSKEVKRVVGEIRGKRGTISRAYSESFLHKYGHIHIYGMANPIPMDAIFVRVNVQRRTQIYKAEFQDHEQRQKCAENYGRDEIVDAIDLITQQAYQLRQETIDNAQCLKVLSIEIQKRLQRNHHLSPNSLMDALYDSVVSDKKVKKEDLRKIKIQRTEMVNSDTAQKSIKDLQQLISMQSKTLELWSEERENYTPSASKTTIAPDISSLKSILKSSLMPTHFVVLGAPGAGKTTLLKQLASESIRGSTDIPRIPVFVPLKEFTRSNYESVLEYIYNEFEQAGMRLSRDVVNGLLIHGKCILLLDGLDEIGQIHTRDAVVRDIQNLSSKYRTTPILVTCRPAAYEGWLSGFRNVEMADFNDEQISQFVTNWFPTDKQIQSDCFTAIHRERPIAELAHNPLLLTLVCLVYESSGGFPKSRTELYQQGVDALIMKWDASRSVKREAAYGALSNQRKVGLLGVIGAQYFLHDKFFVPKRQLVKWAANYLRNIQKRSDDDIEHESDSVIDAIAAQHGLLVEFVPNQYGFSHRTFQEYFAARYIVDFSQKDTLTYLVKHQMENELWREVILMVCEMLARADSFIALIVRKLNQIAEEENLTLFLEAISKQSRSDHFASTFVKRLAVLYSTLGLQGGQSVERDTILKTLGTVPDDWIGDKFRMQYGIARIILREEQNIAEQILGDIEKSVLDKRANSKIPEVPPGLGRYLKVQLRLSECLASDAAISPELQSEVRESLISYPVRVE